MLSPLFFILFPLAMYGIHKLFPYKQPENYRQPTTEQLLKYNKWGNKISGWLMLGFFAISMWLISGPLYDYHNSLYLEKSAAVFIVLPDRFYWVMLSFILLLGLSMFFYNLATRLYMGDDYEGFKDFYNQKVKYNSYKAVRPLCSSFALLGIVLLYFMWNYSIYAYRDKIVVHWYLSVEAKTYSYSQVKSIDYTPAGPKNGDSYTVTFKDGLDWNTPTALDDPNAQKDVDFISRQSGVKINTLLPQ
jgi:hypothetical protein